MRWGVWIVLWVGCCVDVGFLLVFVWVFCLLVSWLWVFDVLVGSCFLLRIGVLGCFFAVL